MRIVSAIAGHNPDLIALSEFRSRPGMALCQAFGANGWPHIVSSEPKGIDNGICVLSRVPVENPHPSPAPPENAVRWLDLELPEQEFAISVVHIITAIPGSKDPECTAKIRFWEALLAAAEARIGEPLLLLGDFNTGLPGIDEDRFHVRGRGALRPPVRPGMGRCVASLSRRRQRVHVV